MEKGIDSVKHSPAVSVITEREPAFAILFDHQNVKIRKEMDNQNAKEGETFTLF